MVPVFDPPVTVLEGLLASIAAQTEPAWECVLVDDGSTDAAVAATLARWAAGDPRFRVVSRAVNGGIAAATNSGIDAARCDVIAFADHDDVVHPEAAAELLGHFAGRPDVDVVYSDEELIDADGRVIFAYHKPDYSPIRHLGHHYLCHLLAMRRDAIGDLRVRQEFEPAQDFDFALRVIEAAAARGRTVGHIARTLYGWRAIDGSIAKHTAQKPGVAAAVARTVADALARRGLHADVRPVEIDGLPTTNMQITYPSPPIDLIERVAMSSPADVAERLAASDRPYLYLAIGDEPADTAAALAAEAAHAGIGIVGPALLHPDNSIASVGRLVSPTLTDAFSGQPWGVGPWGSFLVTREVGAVAPEGALIDVAAARAAGGLATDVGLDAGLAELAERMRRQGSATVSTPAVGLTVECLSIEHDPAAVAADWAACTERLGGVRERFDTTGLQHHRPAPLAAAGELLAAGAVDLVTCDVFDTLVTRPVATPADLFVLLGRSLADDGLLPAGVTPRRFALARRAAEQAARTAVAEQDRDRLPECTIEEIWRAMPSAWRLPVEAMVERELQHEIRHLRPLAPALATLAAARRAGIRVVLVSDTYLSGVQLARVLAGCGVDTAGFDRIVTSSDHRRGKFDGLIGVVIADEAVAPGRVLHLGDNDEADIAAARRAGARAIQVATARAERFVPMPSPELERFSSLHGTDGGLTAAARAAALQAGPPAGAAAPYQFGLAAAGPALAGFARWVAHTATELGATSVHYLLREGATIADLVATVAPQGPPARLVHASRWVDLRAAIVAGTPLELAEALGRRGRITAEHVADALGVDPADVRRVWGAPEVPDLAGFWAGCEALAGDEALRAAIVAHTARLRARVMRQLRRELEPGALEPGAPPLVICDVGWGATIQAGLQRILRAEGVDVELVGLYLALSEPGEQRQARGLAVRSYLPADADDPEGARFSKLAAHHADTVERLLMPTTGTFVDVADDGTPVTAPAGEPHPASLLAAKQGVFDLAAQLTADGFDDDVWLGSPAFRAALAAGLARSITQPAPELAAALVDWPHDDVAGTDARPVGGTSTAAIVPYITARELHVLRQAERAWTEGLAAIENPALAAQMEAERAGISIEHLVPGAVTGPSRLSAFPIGSELAWVQTEQHLGVTVDGWSVLRLTGSYPSLRSVRFDAGTAPALVEVLRWSITLEPAGGDPVTVDVDLAGGDLGWVAAWRTDARRYVETAAGHVVVPIPPAVGDGTGRIETVVVFRRWSLAPGDTLLTPPLRGRLGRQARRVRRAIRRRLR